MQKTIGILAVLLAAQLVLAVSLSFTTPDLSAAKPDTPLFDLGEHSVERLTIEGPDQQRVVLFIDTERPLPWLPRLLNKLVLRVVRWTAYVKDARKNLYDWEERFETAVRTADGFALAADATSETPPVDTGAKSVPNRK